MFVFSVKTNRRQLLAAAGCLVLLVAVIATAVMLPVQPAATTARLPDGTTEEAQVQFLRSLGYVAETPCAELREVQIPQPFDEMFREYNELQKQAGMDLLPYQGMRTKYITYRLVGEADRPMMAHLYVCDGRIIGGDISSAEEGVFMSGLIKAEETGV